MTPAQVAEAQKLAKDWKNTDIALPIFFIARFNHQSGNVVAIAFGRYAGLGPIADFFSENFGAASGFELGHLGRQGR
jgi:hypothetical protein